jgi:hypothetical protein
LAPDTFEAFCQELLNNTQLPFIIFFNISTGLIDFIHQYSASMLTEIRENDWWFARVHNSFALQTQIGAAAQSCTTRPRVIFHRKGEYHSFSKTL